MVKYGAVIGLKTIILIAWKLLCCGHIHKKGCFSTNHSAVFPLVHQATEFRRTTV